MLRYLTAGESHGPVQIGILEGMIAGLNIKTADIQKDLNRRKKGAGRGGRGLIEKDQVKILSGVRFGKTLGSPITLMVENQDFVNWQEIMSIEDNPKTDKEKIKITAPRPGHADLAGVLKYGFDDVRNVLERASARETVIRVAIGAVSRKFLSEFGIKIQSRIIQIGPVRITSPENTRKIDEIISKASAKKDTLGGVIGITASHIPLGLGSYVHYDRRLDGKLAQSLMSIPSVKAVEIGEGIRNSSCFGSQVHDEIYYDEGKKKFFHKTNRAGGIEGGVSNGEDIVLKIYFKPVSTLVNPLKTSDIKTKKPASAHLERSDTCVIPRAGVICEAALAFVLADAFLEKFGGDSLAETKSNFYKNISKISDLRTR